MRPHVIKAVGVTEPAGRIAIQNAPQNAPAQRCGVLTVMSANLWHNWPRYWRLQERLESFARLVEAEKADIILLQEVSRTPDLRADEWLAQRLNMAYAYSRANGHKTIHFEEGLAVFSRFPLSTLYLQQLDNSANPFVRRMALGATIETPCGNLLAFSVHLGLLRRQNATQLKHLRAWIKELARDQAVVVGGDFNAHETRPQIHAARASWLDTYRHIYPHTDGTTHELRWPWGSTLRRQRLDYIFLQPGKPGWKVLEARHIHAADSPHSDHRAVLTRLEPIVG
jgi:endonuclease/exonuclease/phosphatase family metal-dependent hydrolase